MSANSFLKEVMQYVEELVPSAKWETGNGYALLLLDNDARSICFLSDTEIKKMHSSVTGYFILEYFWNKNKDASKSRLCSILGMTSKIHARQCSLSRIDEKQARTFIDHNHIMGYAKSYLSYGLFLKNELVAVACFSKGRKMHRLPPGKYSFELIRFCNKNHFTVVGGLSKLIHHFADAHKPGDIMTYVDISWGLPSAYYSQGFVLDSVSPSITITVIRNGLPDLEFLNKGNYKLIKHY